MEPLTVGFRADVSWSRYRGRYGRMSVVAELVWVPWLPPTLVVPGRSALMWTTKLALARLAGGTFTINTAREALHARLLEMTEGHGPDVVIEAIGLPVTFRAAVEEVRVPGKNRLHRVRQGIGEL